MMNRNNEKLKIEETKEKSKEEIKLRTKIKTAIINGTKRGRWTEKEQEQFLEGIMKFGNEWKNIQKYVQTRTPTQIRSHAQKFFLKLKRNLNTFNISSEEFKNMKEDNFSIKCFFEYLFSNDLQNNAFEKISKEKFMRLFELFSNEKKENSEKKEILENTKNTKKCRKDLIFIVNKDFSRKTSLNSDFMGSSNFYDNTANANQMSPLNCNYIDKNKVKIDSSSKAETDDKMNESQLNCDSDDYSLNIKNEFCNNGLFEVKFFGIDDDFAKNKIYEFKDDCDDCNCDQCKSDLFIINPISSEHNAFSQI